MFPTMTTPHLNSNYPNQTLPQFDNPDFYQHLQAETLFFIFYYMEVFELINQILKKLNQILFPFVFFKSIRVLKLNTWQRKH